MSTTKKDADYELFVQLPKDWPIDQHALSDLNHRWPIEWLKNVARYPHVNESSLKGPFTVITNVDTAESVAPESGFTAMLVAVEFSVERENGTIVEIYRMTPLYPEEVLLHRKQGMKALMEAFDNHDISPVVNLGRPNVASRNVS